MSEENLERKVENPFESPREEEKEDIQLSKTDRQLRNIFKYSVLVGAGMPFVFLGTLKTIHSYEGILDYLKEREVSPWQVAAVLTLGYTATAFVGIKKYFFKV